jgi:AbrB family looped-hinge helix DNA binding protein
VGYRQIVVRSLYSHTERIVVGDRGRVVLPSSVRSALGLKRGTRMLLSTEKDGSLVEELLADRRVEAEREQ